MFKRENWVVTKSVKEYGETREVEVIRGGKIVTTVLLALVFIVALLGSFTVVSPGDKGVVVRLGSINRVLDSGFHAKFPLIEKIEKVTIQTQKEQVETDSASQDLQTVKATVAVNYNVSPDKVGDLFKTIGVDYKTRVIDPAIQEAVKAATAKYTAEQLITQRPLVKEDILSSLKSILSPKDISVSDVSITNFDFSPSFNAAIEAKVTAEQQALQSKNLLEQKKYEAEQTIVTAKAQAEAIRIQAQAITQQGGDNYVKLKELERWDGSRCTTYCFGSDGKAPTPLLNVNK